MKIPDHSNGTAARRRRGIAGVTALAALCLAGASAAGAAPSLSAGTEKATAGYYRLTWEAEDGRVRLQRAPTDDFAEPETLYEGPDEARVLSGEPDGVSYFRVAELEDGRPGPWSEPVKVEVEHHPLSRALLFFGLGGVVFLSTLGLIIHGARKDET